MKPTRLLQMLLTVIPVLSAGLYLLGLSYHQGYLAAFGVDDSLIPLASDKALFTGFFSFLTFTFPAGVYALGALAAVVILVIVAAIFSSTSRVQSIVTRIKVLIACNRLETIASPTADGLINKSGIAYAYVTGFIFILLLLLLMTALSAKSGRRQAEKEIAEFINGKAIRTELFSSELPRGYTGKLIFCGDKYCAFWSRAGTTLLRHEVIERMVTHSHSPMGEAPVKIAPTP